MPLRVSRRTALLAPALLTLAGPARAGDPPLTVFAAASLKEALSAAAENWQAKGHAPVRLVFAGSGTLARQIQRGAPADLFVSADRDWMDRLEQEGRLVPGSRVQLVGNRLVLIARQDDPLVLTLAPGAPLREALGASRLAVGSPETVPAGRYAEAALRSLNLWDSLAPRLAGVENVRVALALVARGEARLGIAYATDALAEPRVRAVATFPADSHPPIRYPAARVAGSTHAEGDALLAFLRSPEAAKLWERFGFSPAE